MRILVTGGLGFIGSSVVRNLIAESEAEVLNFDADTYAATQGAVAEIADSSRYSFQLGDVANAADVGRAFSEFDPDVVMHLAAESHVDRSIDGPGDFIRTNINGTYTMLEAARSASVTRGGGPVRFHHISTDEVFGALGPADAPFNPQTPYSPHSPYSASKAASDHLVRAWGDTYELPVVLSNCSNNYGPFQFPEKLIPLMILKAAAGQALPVYGAGDNVRDWLFVEDHARALVSVALEGETGETYLIGGDAEMSNLDLIGVLCDLVDERVGVLDSGPRRGLVEFVTDRPGHDHRYAVDFSETTEKLGWTPTVTFAEGLAKTIDWYLANEAWWRPITEGLYSGQRLGVTQ